MILKYYITRATFCQSKGKKKKPAEIAGFKDYFLLLSIDGLFLNR